MPAFETKATAERQEIDPVFKDVLTLNFRQLNILVQTQVEVSRLPRTMDALAILKQLIKDQDGKRITHSAIME